MKKLAIVLLIPFLMGQQAGCDTNTQLIIPDIPDHLQHCLPDPLKGKNYKNLNPRQVAHILVAYKSAHADCEAKVNEMRQLYAYWKSQK
jgi:hypothetical protein